MAATIATMSLSAMRRESSRIAMIVVVAPSTGPAKRATCSRVVS